MSGPSSGVVLFAGGGTAGHVFPAVAVARTVVELDLGLRPVFLGTRHRLEGRLVPEAGFPLHHVDVLPIPRRLSPSLLLVPGALRAATRECAALIDRAGAVAAVTFGGYVSAPLALAVRRTSLPLVVHEQNAVPGLANRIAARWADRIAVSFPSTADRFARPERVAVTGNPVRHEILGLDQDAVRPAALRHFQLQQRRRTLLVFGGSQGARTLNRAAVASYGRWRHPEQLQVLHAAGRALYRETAAAWDDVRGRSDGPLVRCVDFIDDMAAAYAAADMIVCRAGATSIAELTVLGKPSVLVPYPHATADHQRYNAVALANAGGARVVLDADLDGRTLTAAVEPLLVDDVLHRRMARSALAFGRPDAAENVARLVAGLVGARAATTRPAR